MKKVALTAFFLLPLFLFSQTDEVFDQYLEQRKALLAADSALYFDAKMRLSPAETKLNRLLQKEQRQLLEHYRNTHFFPPARDFYQSKEHIEGTKIFQVLQQMPKGGILHLHQLAMGDAKWVVEKAIATPEMHVFWEASNDNYVKGQLCAYPEGGAPAGFRPVGELHKAFPSLPEELYGLITFNEDIDRDSVDIWYEFEAIFQRIYRFVTYRPIFPEYLNRGLDILVEDGIQHVELRMPFRNRMYDLVHPDGGLPVEEFAQVLERALERQRQKDPAFSMKVIHTDLRFKGNAVIWEDIQSAVSMKKRYPDWLKGYDLVAEEDNGEATLFHAKTFLRLDSLERTRKVELPLYLHDGESDWASVANLYDAILLGTRRIGHGFNLFRFPNLIEEVKRRSICIEVNPLSNQILGYLRDLRIHPASTYLRRGVDCIISSDDPLIFDYEGLTYDFWSVYMAWELDLAALKQLCRNSLEHAALSEEEKMEALAAWEQKWLRFVDQTLANW